MEHNTPMTEEMLEKIIEKEKKVAEKLLGNPEKLERILQGLEKNLDSIPVAGPLLADLPVLISLVRAYIMKEYTEPPFGTIVAIIAAILYVASPMDLIPDWIPGVGFADDMAVIAFVVKKLDDDLDKYREWQKANGKR